MPKKTRKKRDPNKGYRFGFALGTNYLGYAVVPVKRGDWPGEWVVDTAGRPRETRKETGSEQFSPTATFDQKVEHATATYQRLAAHYGVKEIELKRYTKHSFPRSRAATEGGTLKDHDRLADAVADRLEKAGIAVVWDVVR